MTSLSIPVPRFARAPLLDSSPNGILVASDGREPSTAALIAARKLAPRATFGVLSVVPSASPDDPTFRKNERAIGCEERAALIEAQLQQLFGESPDVWVETSTGYPPAVITSFADLHHTRLLITGIGRERVIDRLRGDESTLSLVRLSNTPVLAVAPGSAVPPRRIVVAMDFTPASIHAAHLALEIAAPHAEVIVAYVWPPTVPVCPEGSMRRIVDTLQTGFCGHVKAHIERGDPATELLTLANSSHADLIAIGLHDHARAEHVGIGACARRIVRCTSCSVLATPRASTD